MSSTTLSKPRKSDADLQRLPVVRQMLQALTHDDEQIRSAARRAAVATLRGKSRSVIIDGLVKSLRRKDADVRQRAGTALVAFGTPAIPALLLGLWKRGDAAWQLRLARVLTAIVPRVPPGERTKLFLEVDRALCLARDEAVMWACLEAQAALMKEGETGQTGEPNSLVQPDEFGFKTRSGGKPAPAEQCAIRVGPPAPDPTRDRPLLPGSLLRVTLEAVGD
jgi:HEAT repeats